WPDQTTDDDSTDLSIRTVFARACDPENTPLADDLRPAIVAELDRASGYDHNHDHDHDHDHERGPQARTAELGVSAGAWAAAERIRFAALFAAAEREGRADVLVRQATLACAPLALLSGAWLQWMSEPGNAEEALTMQVLSLFAGDV